MKIGEEKYKIWSDGGLRDYSDYEPHHQGYYLDLWEIVKEPIKGDYGVFTASFLTSQGKQGKMSEIRHLIYTKNNILNGGQKKYAHYFLIKKGSKYFPRKSEAGKIVYFEFYQSSEEKSSFFDKRGLKRGLKSLCDDYGVEIFYSSRDSSLENEKVYQMSINKKVKGNWIDGWKIGDINLNDFLKGLKSFCPKIHKIVRDQIVSPEKTIFSKELEIIEGE